MKLVSPSYHFPKLQSFCHLLSSHFNRNRQFPFLHAISRHAIKVLKIRAKNLYKNGKITEEDL